MNNDNLVDVTVGPTADREENALRRSFSRRSMIRHTTLGVGLAAALSGVSYTNAFASTVSSATDTSPSIFSAARTAEELAVTMYYNGLHADPHLLEGIFDPNHISYLQGAMWEEKRHRDFFGSLGGLSLATKSLSLGGLLAPQFFFPRNCFTDQTVFLNTLEYLEVVFINAFNDACHEWALPTSTAALTAPTLLGFPAWRLAKIAAQIEGVESEHKDLARDIALKFPSNNDTLADVTNVAIVANLGLDPLNSSAGALLQFVTGVGFDPVPRHLPADSDIARTSTTSIINRLQNDFPNGEASA